MDKGEILQKLENIVGKEFTTNRREDLYIYSQDPGASKPRPVDFVVMPKEVEEVQDIIKLANEEKIPIVPMGGGMTLSGLVIPIKGGIVVDMKRMDRILEINETSRYALIEAGVTTGKLISYLRENYPYLQPPYPDAPTSVTIAGNALIHGSGSLSQKYGHHGAMINGLEVVLPNGEICKVGSGAISEKWFTRGPIPDLTGIFISAFGTMGIITKISIKLYPKPKLRDGIIGLGKDLDNIPKAILHIIETDLVEDTMVLVSDKPEYMKGYELYLVYITGDTEDEIKSKTKLLKGIYRKNKITRMTPPQRHYKAFLQQPQFAGAPADFRKGGGFEYVGSFLPLENLPEAFKRFKIICNKYGLIPASMGRLIGKGHAVMFAASISFNRADPKDMEIARNALHDTNKIVLELGGIPWKSELDGQKLIVEQMDPGYKYLLKTIRNSLDPNGIMNPGNWEVE